MNRDVIGGNRVRQEVVSEPQDLFLPLPLVIAPRSSCGPLRIPQAPLPLLGEGSDGPEAGTV